MGLREDIRSELERVAKRRTVTMIKQAPMDNGGLLYQNIVVLDMMAQLMGTMGFTLQQVRDLYRVD